MGLAGEGGEGGEAGGATAPEASEARPPRQPRGPQAAPGGPQGPGCLTLARPLEGQVVDWRPGGWGCGACALQACGGPRRRAPPLGWAVGVGAAGWDGVARGGGVPRRHAMRPCRPAGLCGASERIRIASGSRLAESLGPRVA